MCVSGVANTFAATHLFCICIQIEGNRISQVLLRALQTVSFRKEIRKVLESHLFNHRVSFSLTHHPIGFSLFAPLPCAVGLERGGKMPEPL